MDTMTNNDEVYVRAILKDGISAKFQAIKRRLGLNSNSEVVRYLIAREYNATHPGGPGVEALEVQQA